MHADGNSFVLLEMAPFTFIREKSPLQNCMKESVLSFLVSECSCSPPTKSGDLDGSDRCAGFNDAATVGVSLCLDVR